LDTKRDSCGCVEIPVIGYIKKAFGKSGKKWEF
jgi:hypothetical protein